MATEKYIYKFGGGAAEGDASMRELLGGKGANLAEMSLLGLPVPPGFTITTKVCCNFLNVRSLPSNFTGRIKKTLRWLEQVSGKKFAGAENFLLVSVRSGAQISMPGMMDTILNIGLNDKTVEQLAQKTNPRFANDCYKRLLQMYKNTVKEELPQDPWDQLVGAISAIFRSWNNPHAIAYRRDKGIPQNLGTAVTIQQMVFGNLNENSGTGVYITRNKNTGEPNPTGEWLALGQGEDVVAGGTLVEPIESFRKKHPELFNQLHGFGCDLERHFRDMQDIEYTVEDGKLYLLQTRSAKRSPAAHVKTAVNFAEEGLISQDEAILRINPIDLEKVLYPSVDLEKAESPIASGIAASPGADWGAVVFTPQKAVAMRNEKTILVREETSVEDYEGLAASAAILTSKGGLSSHAAFVASDMGKPAVVGANLDGVALKEGDIITVDGSNGLVFKGQAPLIYPAPSREFLTLLSWASERKLLGVRANADEGKSAQTAKDMGAEGIGLVRTEHMFKDKERLAALQEFLLSGGKDAERALLKIQEFQKRDFLRIFSAMKELPVTVRLIDPPLHEFLPHNKKISEANPMFGHRGCRLGITNPELTRAQSRALAHAEAEAIKSGLKPALEIMIPLVSDERELAHQISIIRDEFRLAEKELNMRLPYSIGTMIELPRACLIAQKLAKDAEFFSFGTNDLVQSTYGLSRDDANTFLPHYIENQIFSHDPFRTIDEEGVGELVRMAIERGGSARGNLKIGVCGDHAGDPRSIQFFHKAGIDYVSCKIQRIPTAIVAAAQAAINNNSRAR